MGAGILTSPWPFRSSVHPIAIGRFRQAPPPQFSSYFDAFPLPAVADYKHRFNLPVTDQQQEEAVLVQVAAQAREAKLDEQRVQQLFSVQIELAKQVQRAFLQDQQEGLIFPAWAQGLDLSTDLRPVLLELGNRIVREVTHALPALQDRDALLRMAEEEITASILSPTERHQLGESLWQIGQSGGL